MNFDELLTHPYKEQIDDLCLRDTAIAQITNWIKNTVDEDPSIPEEKRQAYYITNSKIKEYKILLREKVGSLTVSSPVVTPVLSGEIINPESLQLRYDEKAVTLKLIEEDAKQQLLNTTKTFVNIAKKIESRLEDIQQKLDGGQLNSYDQIHMEKNFRGYLVELRNLMKDYNTMTGAADFFKKMGENMGDAVSKNILDKAKQEDIKKILMELLSEIEDIDLIPKYLQKFEEVFNRDAK